MSQSSKIFFLFRKRQHKIKKKSERNTHMPSPGQQQSSRRFFLAKTLCGSLVAGACGYYGALHCFTSLLDRRRFKNGLFSRSLLCLFSARQLNLFFPILLSNLYSRVVLLTIITFCSGERDQRLAKLPEVSTSDGSIRDGVLRAE